MKQDDQHAKFVYKDFIVQGEIYPMPVNQAVSFGALQAVTARLEARRLPRVPKVLLAMRQAWEQVLSVHYVRAECTATLMALRCQQVTAVQDTTANPGQCNLLKQETRFFHRGGRSQGLVPRAFSVYKVRYLQLPAQSVHIVVGETQRQRRVMQVLTT